MIVPLIREKWFYSDEALTSDVWRLSIRMVWRFAYTKHITCPTEITINFCTIFHYNGTNIDQNIEEGGRRAYESKMLRARAVRPCVVNATARLRWSWTSARCTAEHEGPADDVGQGHCIAFALLLLPARRPADRRLRRRHGTGRAAFPTHVRRAWTQRQPGLSTTHSFARSAHRPARARARNRIMHTSIILYTCILC